MVRQSNVLLFFAHEISREGEKNEPYSEYNSKYHRNLHTQAGLQCKLIKQF